MSQQDVLLSVIRKKIKSGSLIEAVAVALGISYDAAHRRVSSKSKFSIEEAVVLCRHYKISIDAILTGSNTLVVEKTKEIEIPEDMTQYFRQSADYLHRYENQENISLFYAAKDIPLFYMIGGTLLSKFKLYVWMELLTGVQKPFESFSMPENLQQHISRIKTAYDRADVHEIWNDTTINSTLQQIFYFFESGLLSKTNAELLYEDMRGLLSKVEAKCDETAGKFHLYFNELLILNNNVIVSSIENKTMFIPYTALGYFITEDEVTCQKAFDYFLRQIKSSKSLNLSGTRDRKIFFNKAGRKIDFYIKRLNDPEELMF
ncbi:hypothetical protein HUK80_12625 [Flavobacterium sp. MAH-1]|uniref:BetR domain-containing protein n=2 Tax=Flavobacterium agri TaxID=2743471 RepID=A0A7Y8Y368_9FLAO|nr:hypothetical protein [Flavobacterium agri]NUY81745.1 hypothetical protein [Flavobacterium agri]NYA71769.1 hypothetical protein [Flavobacterium agri]